VSAEHILELEVLTGPLDGHIISLQADAEWTGAGSGPLAFPWDDELGEPQVLLTLDEHGWGIESRKSPHGTYRINQEEKVQGRIQLEQGDVLKASNTWLLIHRLD
jgi:hypothetical protein